MSMASLSSTCLTRLLRLCSVPKSLPCWNAVVVSSVVRHVGSHAIRSHRASLGLVMKQNLPLSARSRETLSVEANEPGNRHFTREIMRLGRQRRWVEAKQLFEGITQKNTIVYSALLSVAQQCGRFEEGLGLFREMAAKGFPLTEPVYVSGMQLHAGAKRYTDGLALYEDMRTKSIACNPPPYIAAMNLCSPLKRYAEAATIWEDMLAARVDPSSSAYTAILNVAASTGAIGKVEAHVADMRKHGMLPNSAQFGTLLKACRTCLDMHQALEYLKDFQAWPGKRTVVHFTIVMSIFRLLDPTSNEFVDRRGQITQLVKLMTEQEVASDRFFLEEYVAALLGGDLKDILHKRVVPTASSIQDALHVLSRTSLGRTSMTKQVEKYLRG